MFLDSVWAAAWERGEGWSCHGEGSRGGGDCKPSETFPTG